MEITEINPLTERMIENIGKVIVGKHRPVKLALISLFCQGHLLIEDVPGVGKTMLARSLAKTVGLSFSRIQFTPDMLPSDITGVSIFNQETRQFEFRPGPIFSQIILADEINRATPKTQAALLEAMEERQVTIDGVTRFLPSPFMVMATQNPIEYEGTFPLPEAQLDRFFMRIRIGYPSLEDEMRILDDQQYQHPINTLESIITVQELIEIQETIRRVYLSTAVKRYVVTLIRYTRNQPNVYLGSSPRGSLALARAGQAKAAMEGRDYVLPDDIKDLAPEVLSHRLILAPASKLRDYNERDVILEALNNVAVPGGDPMRRIG
ncbi:MAG: MoxR family ATPase [Anaerolineales bacterium]|nr:MoxR family ATPase [Anaerolineales bacterium]